MKRINRTTLIFTVALIALFVLFAFGCGRKAVKEEKLAKPNDTFGDLKFYRPKESKECPEGYKGRIGIYEVLPITETIKDLIVKEADADRVEEQAKSEGMRTMIEDGFVKAAQGITSIEEVLRVIVE